MKPRKRQRRESFYGWLNRGLARIGAGAGLFYVMHCPRRPGPVSAWDPDGIEFTECDSRQVGWLAGYDPARAPVFAQRFATGWRCFAAAAGPDARATETAERRCLGYLWIAAGPGTTFTPGGQFRWRLPAAAGWGCDSWAHPLAVGLYPDLVRFARGKLWDEGVRSYWGAIEFNNRTSQRVHRALGGEAVGWTLALHWGRWQLHCDRASGRLRLRRPRTPVPLAAFVPAAPVALTTPAALASAAGEDTV